MKTVRNIVLCSLLVLCSLVLFGCGKKADENKPLSEVKAEADKMSAGKLRAMAVEYKEAIAAKGADVKKITGKLEAIAVTEMLGKEAKELKSEIDDLNGSVSALRERFDVYYNKLKEKGGSLSGLEI